MVTKLWEPTIVELERRVKVAEQMPRDLTHGWVSVKIEVDGHIHIVSGLSMDYGESWGTYIEDAAEEVSETILDCHNRRERERLIIQHSMDDANAAYKEAISQLATRDYYKEYLDLQRKILFHHMWGGPVPAMILQPNPEDEGKWQWWLTHPETGRPTIYAIDDVFDMGLPDPKEFHKGKLGYYRKGG